jgi:hypothetical protein
VRLLGVCDCGNPPIGWRALSPLEPLIRADLAFLSLDQLRIRAGLLFLSLEEVRISPQEPRIGANLPLLSSRNAAGKPYRLRGSHTIMSNKPMSDDDRLVDQHESAKANVEQDLNSEVSLRAEKGAHQDSATLDSMAAKVKQKAVAEVGSAAKMSERRRGIARTVQVIDFLFCTVYVLLAVRLVLGLIGANQASGFVQLIVTVTDPFFAFFRGIVQSPTVEGGYTIGLPILVAAGAYGLLHWGVRSSAKLMAYRRSEI